MFSSLRRAAFFSLPLVLAACGDASSKSDEAAGAADAGALYEESGAKADMFVGKADAPITVVEYASVTCPHCAAFHEGVFPAIKEKYIDTGKVKFVFREFPTPPQSLSYIGSVLARCAADKGGSDAYFAVLSSLFRTQRTWVSENAKIELQKIAAQAGMDQAAFDACVQRQDLVDLITKNVEVANEKYDVNATPSFMIGGKLERITSLEDFDKVYEAQTAKSN